MRAARQTVHIYSILPELALQARDPETAEGVGVGHAPTGFNEYNRVTYTQASGAGRQITDDPHHDTSDVLVHLQGVGSVATNGGFVLDYARNSLDLRASGK